MQFVLIAHDHTDDDVMNRRMAVREEHLQLIAKLKAEGRMHFGGALLDDDEKMIGSVIVSEFDSKEELYDKWLDIDPYFTHKVWDKEKSTVSKYSIAPSFVAK